jgi:hypothetical protein
MRLGQVGVVVMHADRRKMEKNRWGENDKMTAPEFCVARREVRLASIFIPTPYWYV